MTFVHEDADFQQLLHIVASETGIAAALIEKDYWVTHTLWALHETGLEIWFKGGTSLSKGFGLIRRFSEDLDLMVQHGSVANLPPVSNWTSTNKGSVTKRRAFYDALTDALVVPGVRVVQDPIRADKRARGAEYLGHYPGALLDQLASAMSPFVRLEIGSARVVPFVEQALSSHVHDVLDARRMLGDFVDNRPGLVRCVHPLVTLIEKLDAIQRRYGREKLEADSFARHYEDAARIIQSSDELPAANMTTAELAADMLEQRDIAKPPKPDDPAFLLADDSRRLELERAYEKIAPMFWGTRIPLAEACAIIRTWIQQTM